MSSTPDSAGGLERIAEGSSSSITVPKNDIKILLKLLEVGHYSVYKDVIEILDPDKKWPDVTHFSSDDPLCQASDAIINFLSDKLGHRPSGYSGQEHLYVERSGIITGKAEPLDLPRVQFYNWLFDLQIPILSSADKDLHQPQSIDLVIFEHPDYKKRFIFQAMEKGQVRNRADDEWTKYSCLFDAGAYLSGAKRILSLQKMGLMPTQSVLFN